MSRIVALLFIAPILLVVGAVVTGLAFVFDALSQYNDPFATAAQYGIALLIAASGAVSLVAISRRGKHRAGLIVGVILTALAALVCGLPFVLSIGALIYSAVLSAQPPTAQETTSMMEVRVQTRELFDDLGLPNGESSTTVYGCMLSNLDDGDQLSSFEVFHLSPEDKDAALDSIAAQWESLGYDVERSDDVLVINDQRLIETARVSWHEQAGNLAIDVRSICVVEG